MDDRHFRQLLEHLELSWNGYQKVRKGVKKRIARHMHQMGCHTMEAYLSELRMNKEARRECEQRMTVSISRFFRDRQFWQILETAILPDRVQNKKKTFFKVWSAGCACGEEVYSFRIIWNHLERSHGTLPNLEITATDLNPNYLDRARTGVFHLGSLKEVSQDVRFTYFDSNARSTRFTVKPVIKKNIIWKQHDLLTDPPGSDFDVIFLRNNLLTYYQDRLKECAFRAVIESLASSGIIIIGSHERLPNGIQSLKSIAPYSYVFEFRTL
jgi:chemotaxis methyl-accepting protein methylase